MALLLETRLFWCYWKTDLTVSCLNTPGNKSNQSTHTFLTQLFKFCSPALIYTCSRKWAWASQHLFIFCTYALFLLLWGFFEWGHPHTNFGKFVNCYRVAKGFVHPQVFSKSSPSTLKQKLLSTDKDQNSHHTSLVRSVLHESFLAYCIEAEAQIIILC